MELSGYAKGFSNGFNIGMRVFATHIINHPEIGAVLDSQCGAQSEGCCFDTVERSEEAAPEWLLPILAETRIRWAADQPGLVSAVLASDGWWWRIV